MQIVKSDYDLKCIRIYSVGVWNKTEIVASVASVALEFTPLEFETKSQPQQKQMLLILEFTPLEF